MCSMGLVVMDINFMDEFLKFVVVEFIVLGVIFGIYEDICFKFEVRVCFKCSICLYFFICFCNILCIRNF